MSESKAPFLADSDVRREMSRAFFFPAAVPDSAGTVLRNLLGGTPPRPGPPYIHTIAPHPEAGAHSDPHFTGGLCVCGCDDCTLRLIRQCVCPECPCETPEDHAVLADWS